MIPGEIFARTFKIREIREISDFVKPHHANGSFVFTNLGMDVGLLCIEIVCATHVKVKEGATIALVQ